jgi:hypothetical protein
MADEVLLKTGDVAKRLGCGKTTVQGMRRSATGPPFLKLPYGVRYPAGQLEEWIAAHRGAK